MEGLFQGMQAAKDYENKYIAEFERLKNKMQLEFKREINMIQIKQAKKIREDLGLTHILIVGIDEKGVQHVATHGKTQKQANEAATYGNLVKSHLGWPKDKCNTKPLERICENCHYWKMKKHYAGDPIPAKFPGQCFYEPELLNRFDKDIACKNFEPNS